MSSRRLRRALVAALVLGPVGAASITVATHTALADAVAHPWSLASVQGASANARSVGLDDDTYLSSLLSAVTNGTTSLPFDVRPYRTDARARLRVVNASLPVVKRVVGSDLFRRLYADYRADQVTVPDPEPVPDMSQARDQQKQQMREAIANLEQNARSSQLPASVRSQMREAANQMRAQLRELEAQQPSAEQLAEERQQAVSFRTAQQEEVTRRRAELATQWPTDPNVLVAKRVRDFLALTENMPWDARLTQNAYGKKVFADATLEAKGDDWKLCFRAGRETVTAARTFAQAWLAELSR